MGTDDKFENLTDEKVGEAKETFGRATDNEDLEAEGKGDQTKANVKEAGENVKDAADKVKDAFS
jgi:uncharacterized protein YjbJ (UPF0337 family)